MLQQFIAPAISFGLSAAAIPGPLIAYLVNTALTQGWRRALLVVISPLITDTPIIILMTFILGQLPPALLNLLQLAGGCLLLFIAWGAYKQFRDRASLELAAQSASAATSWQRVLLTGILMNFLSPGPWLFWATINGPLLVKALDTSEAHAFAFLIAFYGTFLGGLCLWVLAFHHVRRVPARQFRYIILATAALLTWFGFSLITAALT